MRAREKIVERAIERATLSLALHDRARERGAKHGAIFDAHRARRTNRIDRRRRRDASSFAANPPQKLVDELDHGVAPAPCVTVSAKSR